jgi:hypothetical protein
MKIIKTRHPLATPTAHPNHGGVETYDGDLSPPTEGAEILSVTSVGDGDNEQVVVLWLAR